MVLTVSLDIAEGGDGKGDPDSTSEMSLLLKSHTQLFILSSTLRILKYRCFQFCIELLLVPGHLNIYKCNCLPGIWWSGLLWMVISKMLGWNLQGEKQACKEIIVIQWENCVSLFSWVPRYKLFPYLNMSYNYGWPGHAHDSWCDCIHSSKSVEQMQNALDVTSALVTEGNMKVYGKHGYWSVREVVLDLSYSVYFAYTLLFMYTQDWHD